MYKIVENEVIRIWLQINMIPMRIRYSRSKSSYKYSLIDSALLYGMENIFIISRIG